MVYLQTEISASILRGIGLPAESVIIRTPSSFYFHDPPRSGYFLDVSINVGIDYTFSKSFDIWQKSNVNRRITLGSEENRTCRSATKTVLD